MAAVHFEHGLIHCSARYRAPGWAEVDTLKQPIGHAMGLAWLAAGVFVVAVLLLVAPRIAWAFAVVPAAASQNVIITSWSDAKA